MCCGGWFIEIDDSNYRFGQLPDNCHLDIENEIYPIHVIVDWKMEKNPCLGDEIIIKWITKINK